MALKDADVAKKLGLSNLNQSRIATQEEYLQFMQNVYDDKNFHYLNQGLPGDAVMGITNSYLKNHGVAKIQFEQLNGLRDYEMPHGYTEVQPPNMMDALWDKLDKGIKSGKPIIMSTGFSEQKMIPIYSPGKMENKTNRTHFVTIVGTLTENDVRYIDVSSWGDIYRVSYEDYVESFNKHQWQNIDPIGFISDDFYMPKY